MKVTRRHEAKAVPWKNGGGITHELAVFPEGADFGTFQWRLSVAEVSAEGMFSAFPGVDRSLTLLQGDGMTLDLGEGAVTLTPGSPPLAFPGEARVVSRLPGGPVLDFNVMTRRDVARHHVHLVQPPAALPDGTRAILCRFGTVTLGDAVLPAGDFALLEPGEAAGFDGGLGGQGEAICVVIEMMDEAAASDEYPSRTGDAPRT